MVVVSLPLPLPLMRDEGVCGTFLVSGRKVRVEEGMFGGGKRCVVGGALLSYLLQQ